MVQRPHKDLPDAAVLSLRIQPRASKNEILPMPEGALKVRLTAPPVDNAANEALIKFLAARLSVPKSRLSIVSGHTSRDKRIRIEGMTDQDAMRLLNPQRG